MTTIVHLIVMIVAPVAGSVTIVCSIQGDLTVASSFGSVGGGAAMLWLFFDWLNDREFRRDLNHATETES